MAYYIIDGSTGDTIESGGSPGSTDAQDSVTPNQDRSDTPQPDLVEHNFEDDRRRERERIVSIVYNPFFDPRKLPN